MHKTREVRSFWQIHKGMPDWNPRNNFSANKWSKGAKHIEIFASDIVTQWTTLQPKESIPLTHSAETSIDGKTLSIKAIETIQSASSIPLYWKCISVVIVSDSVRGSPVLLSTMINPGLSKINKSKVFRCPRERDDEWLYTMSIALEQEFWCIQ